MDGKGQISNPTNRTVFFSKEIPCSGKEILSFSKTSKSVYFILLFSLLNQLKATTISWEKLELNVVL